MNNTFYNDQWSELYHYGVKGQVHGRRRYQNPDGSLTPEGYEHYGYSRRELKQMRKGINNAGHNIAQAKADYVASQDRIKKQTMEIGNRQATLELNKHRWSKRKQEKFNNNTEYIKERLKKDIALHKMSASNYAKYKNDYEKLYKKLANNKLLEYKISKSNVYSDRYNDNFNTQSYTSASYNKFKIKNAKKNGKQRWDDSKRKTYNDVRRYEERYY